MKLLFVFLAFLATVPAQQIPGIYIVELEGEPALTVATKAGLPRQAAADRRAAVQIEQTRMRAALELRGARITSSTGTLINSLTVEIPESQVATLRSMPGVKKIYPVFTYHLELDHAPTLHKAVQAWEAIGGEEKAGEGVKIGIIDDGIDINHPGLQGFEKTPPEGFPKVLRESDLAFTNNKVIVAKSYAASTSQPTGAHGTAVSMIVAGVRNQGPYGTIAGMAPGAFLGNYIVFDSSGRAANAGILRAIDDAVADGMDVINLSLGSTPAPAPNLDVLYQAVERASAAGVIVTKSAGNDGPDPGTLSSPVAPSAIAVGANWNGRILVPSGVKVGDAPLYGALPGNGPPPPEPISGPMIDVAGIDNTGLACEPLPAGSLAGKVALIFRGVCVFEIKFNNAQAAGATAAVVYTDDREVSRMDQVSAPLPALMVTNGDGLRIKRLILDTPDVQATMYFDFVGVPVDPNEVVEFSSRGPASESLLKPDLVATGAEVYTAYENTGPDGEFLDATNYRVVFGTSFAAPMVAGAAALLKAALPDRKPEEIRSLLINSATRLVEEFNGPSPVNSGGAGVLDIEAALKNTATAFPTALSFGAAGETIDASRELKITNVSGTTQTYAASASPLNEGVVPDFSESLFTIEPGDSKTLTVRLNQTGLATGAHQGFLTIAGVDAGTVTRVPFFYAVKSSTPAFLTIFNAPTTAAPNSNVSVLVRLSDAAGLPIDDIDPAVTVATGTGRVVSVTSAHGTYPGTSRVTLRLSTSQGNNVFRFTAGEIVRTVSIRAALGL